ncbi:replication initiation protein [Lentibacillus sediminis]|uniref:replication initiation protein n=1 Tax=Lentibacillus sediminis TaxID=1940529 RepID=UPI000C1BE662|nr:replication initiation protein [Lentibacillus sediminis]
MSQKKRSNDKKVIQTNDLIESIYDTDLTAMEKKIIRYAASKIENNPGNFPDVELTVNEFTAAAGIKGKGYYSRVIEIADELTKKRIKVQDDDGIGWFPWLSGIVYHDGVVYVTFNNLIKKQLLELSREFTVYDFPHLGDTQGGGTN